MKLIQRITILLTTLVLTVATFLSGQANLSAFNFYKARASTTVISNLKNSDPIADLRGANIEGLEFNLKNFNFDTKKTTQLLTVLEVGYSYASSSDFALYFYVYNPEDLKFDTEANHTITLRFNDKTFENYNKYALKYVSLSQMQDFVGLFYKFTLDETALQDIWAKVNSTERVYSVGEIDLVTNAGTYENGKVGETFKYSGYMLGYGQSYTESTIKCDIKYDKVFNPKVNFTYYRPEGTITDEEGNVSRNTQDQLSSVYFSVPNNIIEEFGKMTAVHASWYNAVLKYAFVTGNETIYEAFRSKLGQKVQGYNIDLKDTYFDYFAVSKASFVPNTGADGHLIGNINYNVESFSLLDETLNLLNISSLYPTNLEDYVSRKEKSLGRSLTEEEYQEAKKDFIDIYCYIGNGKWLIKDLTAINERGKNPVELSTLYLLFGTKNKIGIWESADGFMVSGNALREALTIKPNATDFTEKYNMDAFYTVSEIIDNTVYADKEYSLNNNIDISNWWQKFWGDYKYENLNESLKNVKAIYEVTDNDLPKDKEVSDDEIKTICDSLLISTADFDDFLQFYNDATAENETVYLFRFDQNKYFSEEATTFCANSRTDVDKIDTNNYFFSMTAHLDFDVIDLTFTKDGISTVIPCAMSPEDFFADATPPIHTTSDDEGYWKLIIAFILGLALLIVAWPVVSPVIGFVFKGVFVGVGYILKATFIVITSPFKLFKKRRRK